MAHQLKDGGKEALRMFAKEFLQTNLTDQPTRQSPPNSITNEIFKRQTVRRKDLRRPVPLSDTTIYDLEKRGEFPKRFYLTSRCVVWPLDEVLTWLDDRKAMSAAGEVDLAPSPDFRLRAAKPVQPRAVSE